MNANPALEPILTLMTRNLFEVFDERDVVKRQAAIKHLFTEDATFSDPHGNYQGRTGVESAASGLHRIAPPTFRFTVRERPQVLVNAGRIKWAFGPPDQPDKITGTDFAVIQDDKIAAMYTFVDGVQAGG
jgi:hypothetical protein